MTCSWYPGNDFKRLWSSELILTWNKALFAISSADLQCQIQKFDAPGRVCKQFIGSYDCLTCSWYSGNDFKRLWSSETFLTWDKSVVCNQVSTKESLCQVPILQILVDQKPGVGAHGTSPESHDVLMSHTGDQLHLIHELLICSPWLGRELLNLHLLAIPKWALQFETKDWVTAAEAQLALPFFARNLSSWWLYRCCDAS